MARQIPLNFTNDVIDTPVWIKAFHDKSDVVVTKHAEFLAWHDMVKKAKKGIHDEPLFNEDDPFTDVLVDQKIEQFISEKKYYPFKHGYIFNDYPSLGEIWDESLSFYLATIPTEVAEHVKHKLSMLYISEFKSHASLVKMLKALGDHSKKYGDIFSGYWVFFVNLEMCWKFGSTYNIDELKEDVVAWFSPHTMAATFPTQYYEAYRLAAAQFVNLYWRQPKKEPLTWDQWLASGTWGTTGATDSIIPLLEVKTKEGYKTSKSAKTKNATLIAQDWQHYSPYLNKLRPQTNKVTIKPDEAPNKTRLIVSGDNVNYLLMAYVSTWFEDHISGDVSSLFKNSKQMANMWMNMASSCDDDLTVKTPIDQSHFDHHATAEMIYISMLSILEICPDGSDVQKAMQQIIENIFDVDAEATFDAGGSKLKVSWRNGVPSGWRWTALIDTMINYAQFETAKAIIVSLGSPTDVALQLFQGDDVNLGTWGYNGAVRIVRTYALTGLEVNASKFFSDTVRDEFLRRVGRRGFGVAGYPARTTHSLLWKSPNAVRGVDRPLAEMMENWLVYKRRGATDLMYEHMVNDMHGATKISHEEIKEWINTPTSVGGGGLFDYAFGGKNWRSIIQSRIFPRYRLASKPRGLVSMARYAGILLTRRETNMVVKGLVTPQKHYAPEGIDTINTVINKRNMVPLEPAANAVYDLQPIWNHEIPKPLRQVLISRAMKSRSDVEAWSKMKSGLDIRSIPTFDHLKSNASNNVFSDWLLGGISVKVPKSIRLSTDFIAGTVSDAYTMVLKRALGMHRITRRTIMRVQLNLEIRLRFGYQRRLDLLSYGLNPDTVVIAS
jgi:hypothetical protein